MCGIAGVMNFNGQPVSSTTIQKMTDIIRHRGPDDEGQYIAGSVGLGHRRLSIIDLSEKGHQPMSNEDGTIWIVYNGEIYNYRSLNQELVAKGHRITSNCDTESILHLYEEYGTDCVHHLRGMFSFAIWDSKQQLLFAAVDRLRIKPFYYTQIGDTFLFASELKAILASDLYQGKLSYEAIHHYLSFQTVPVPMTIYENIFTLPGGHALTVHNGQVDVFRYWDISFEVADGYSEELYKKQLRELLAQSVEMRLMSDVPLGAFLSGGIDSSVVVGLMHEAQPRTFKTFSIGYDVGGKEYDDTYYAQLVSRRYQTDHTVQVIKAGDVLRELKNFIWYLDEPSTDAINSYFVSKLAARDVTVVLCGQGGDELFAGYQTFDLLLEFMARDRKWERLPTAVRKALVNVYQAMPGRVKKNPWGESIDRFLFWYGSFVKKYSTLRMELTEAEKHQLYSELMRQQLNGTDSHAIYQRYYEQLPAAVDPINRVSYLDLKVHLGDVLMRDVDVMSMAFSLETRIPLIDHKLVEFVATLPPALKLKDGKKKYIFIEAVKDLLPPEVLTRRKLGFAFPFPIWLKNELRPLVDFVLSKEVIERRGLFDFDSVNRLKQDFYSGKNLRYRKIWGLVILELWLRLVQEGDHQFFERLNAAVNLKMD